MIAKHQVVDRVVMFPAVADTASDWQLVHVAPSARYWGLAHDREGTAYPGESANRSYIGPNSQRSSFSGTGGRKVIQTFALN